MTQIVCGEIFAEVASMVHNIKKALKIPLNCICCNPARYEKIGNNDGTELSVANVDDTTNVVEIDDPSKGSEQNKVRCN